MHVLNLVSNADARFFKQQVTAIERLGVNCTTLAVPGKHSSATTEDETRSIIDYVKFHPKVFKHSFDSYDLIHANYGLTAPAALAQPNLPVVLSLWGSEVMSDCSWLKWLSRQAAHRVDMVIAPSQAMSPHIPCSHSVIPFGVNTEQFSPIPKEEARKRIEWDTDSSIVLFPYPPTREVKNYPRAAEVVDRLDINAELRWITGVPYSEMPYYMNASDALLVTSNHESGPMVIKEAAACNIPVVSTDVGFVRQVLNPISNSAVCESDTELVTQLEHILRSDRRSNGRESISVASIEQMGDRILDVYNEVLGQSAGQTAGYNTRRYTTD